MHLGINGNVIREIGDHTFQKLASIKQQGLWGEIILGQEAIL